jgi:hypothetical protein
MGNGGVFAVSRKILTHPLFTRQNLEILAAGQILRFE